jgi:hypothetical protein
MDTILLLRKRRRVELTRPGRPKISIQASATVINELGRLLAKQNAWCLKNTSWRGCYERWQRDRRRRA